MLYCDICELPADRLYPIDDGSIMRHKKQVCWGCLRAYEELLEDEGLIPSDHIMEDHHERFRENSKKL